MTLCKIDTDQTDLLKTILPILLKIFCFVLCNADILVSKYFKLSMAFMGIFEWLDRLGCIPNLEFVYYSVWKFVYP